MGAGSQAWACTLAVHTHRMRFPLPLLVLPLLCLCRLKTAGSPTSRGPFMRGGTQLCRRSGQGGRPGARLPPTRVREPSSCPDSVLLVFPSCFSPTAHTAHPVMGAGALLRLPACCRSRGRSSSVEAGLGLLPPQGWALGPGAGSSRSGCCAEALRSQRRSPVAVGIPPTADHPP